MREAPGSATQTKDAPRRGSYASGKARRERLQRAVLELVREQGVAGVTHRSVARKAGVPLASTTYYFETKLDMLRSAFDAFTREAIERLDRSLPAYPSATINVRRAVDLIESVLIEELDEAGRPWVVELELLLAVARDPSLSGWYSDYQAKLDAALQRLMSDLGSRNARQDARILLAFTRGYELESLSNQSEARDWRRRLRRDLGRLIRRLVDVA